MGKDVFYMKKAIEIAKQARGRTSPNPMSGAVVVKDDEIVGEGFYAQAGGEPAEIHALKAAGDKADGAILYVVVEPYSNRGHGIPSYEYIKSCGIKKVIVAMEDPILRGKGINSLLESNLEVIFGVEKDTAEKINEAFIKYNLTKLPFVNMVNSMTLDGKIATVIGDREWIISDESRNMLHEFRGSYDAVLVGVNTVIRDNPQLNCKMQGGRDPLIVVLDSYGKTPVNSKLFIKNTRDDHKSNVIVAVSSYAIDERIKNLTAAGAEVIVCGEEGDDYTYPRIDLKKLMGILGKKGITSVLIEGGGNLNASALQNQIIDKITIFITPRIVGGKEALTPVEGEGISLMSGALELKDVSYNKIGQDLLIEGYLK
jgi:diaminohydroxyphosphoribosylaminopyrimidine deaminase/5-amino-6-(5-phosphoribosylamino)uracil reductase